MDDLGQAEPVGVGCGGDGSEDEGCGAALGEGGDPEAALVGVIGEVGGPVTLELLDLGLRGEDALLDLRRVLGAGGG